MVQNDVIVHIVEQHAEETGAYWARVCAKNAIHPSVEPDVFPWGRAPIRWAREGWTRRTEALTKYCYSKLTAKRRSTTRTRPHDAVEKSIASKQDEASRRK